MEFPNDLKYTKSHEWVKVDGDKAIVGITEYAQSEISDVVYIELPDIGKEVNAGDVACVVESVKAAFDIYSPVSGRIVEINEALEDDPALVNNEPFSGGWLFKLEGVVNDEVTALMDADTYKSGIENK